MRKLAPALVVATFGIAAGFAATGGACGSDSCIKDTDCEMPLVCIESACVKPGGEHDVAPPDSDVPPDADDVLDGDIAEGGADEAADADAADADADGACLPTTSAPITLEPGLGTTEASERPIVLPSDTGFVYFGHARGGADPTDCLHFARLDLDGRLLAPPVCAVTGAAGAAAVVALSRIVGFAVAYAVSAGPAPGVHVQIVAPDGTSDGAAFVLPGTDASSGQPALTFDGTRIVVVLTQTTATGAEIQAELLDGTTGEPISTGAATLATGAVGTGEPRILWAGLHLTVAYFDATDGTLRVLVLDATLAVLARHVLRPDAGDSFVGYPALAWSGTDYGLAWETRNAASARIHLATFRPGETPVDHDPLSATVPLAPNEQGQVALAWADVGGDWGLAWRRSESGRRAIRLVRIGGADFRPVEEPIDLHPGPVTASHPSLATNTGVFLVAWVEDPTYALALGCSP